MHNCLYILYQFNEKYAPYAGVSMTSLFENNKAAESIYVYILGENLSEASKSKFAYLAEKYDRRICFVRTDELIEVMKQINMPAYRGSYAANMRLFVSEIVGDEEEETERKSSDKDRLLYLDADTIVTGDIRSMYESSIRTVGMVYDSLGCRHKYGIGLSADDGYYNSGVILYDVDKWRDGEYTRKIVEHVRNVRAQYPSPDQDLLNVVLKGEITPLPLSCNYQPHLKDYPYELFTKAFAPSPFYSEKEAEEAAAAPVILHAYRYLGEFAWHKGNLHPFNEEFDKYLAISPWNNYVKGPSDGGFSVKAEKLLYRLLPKKLFLGIFKIAHGRFYEKADKMSQKNQIDGRM